MAVATKRGDVEEFVRGLECGTAIVEALDLRPTFLDWLLARAGGRALQGEIARALLADGAVRDSAWAREAMRLSAAKLFREIPAETIAHERLMAQDGVAAAFADVDEIKEMRREEERESPFAWVSGLLSDDADDEAARVGRYAENLRMIEIGYDWMAPMVPLEGFERRGAASLRTHDEWEWLVMSESFTRSMGRLLLVGDDGRARARGVTIMLALEDYRDAHGAYPASLEELPGFDAAARAWMDPYSGKPLRYRLTDRATDPLGRGYVLWSVGRNGEDEIGTGAQAVVNAADPRRIAAPGTPQNDDEQLNAW